MPSPTSSASTARSCQDHHLKTICAGRHAVERHAEEMGLEGGNGPEIDLWHLILSLRVYAKAAGLEFDTIALDAKIESRIIFGAEQ